MSLKEPIAFGLFLVTLTVSVAWMVSRMQPPPQIPPNKAALELPWSKRVSDTTIYEIPFCYLVKFPRIYDGKLIRTRAIFDNGIDWSSFKHEDCADYESRISAVGAYDPSDRLIEAKSPQKISLALARLMSEGWDGPLEVDVEVVGRFYAASRGNGARFVTLYEVEAKPIRKRWELVYD